ncbi:OLC1v1030592C1 [Oldenlandia corymbosa var. corymbosa]|uniref:OLC1v1030592C1 n=1 Tax=Oldenlandia corymbosa var. corymbosa TaxID=529605 RepID=A0AAV1CJR5_OLDCO|nr:OLC1v1030592C1 [Oldenlandia corymbosa var. corymbosa]
MAGHGRNFAGESDSEEELDDLVDMIMVGRMDVDLFMRFCQVLRDGGYIELSKFAHVSTEQSVCMFLHLASHNARQRVLAKRFQHSTETINRQVRQVLRAICNLSTSLIRTRNEHTTHHRILEDNRYYPWFKVHSIIYTQMLSSTPALMFHCVGGGLNLYK